MGIFESVEQKKTGLFSSVGVAKPMGFSIASTISNQTKTSTPYTTDFGTRELLNDVLSFSKDIFAGADYTAGGIARNTLLGIPKATKDVFFPTRGFTEQEIKEAKPTFGEKITALPRYAAEFSSSLGDIVGSIFTGPLYEASKTPMGSLFADVGSELSKLGKPQTPGEAQTMRIGDVVNVLPVGSIKVSTSAAEAIAKSKNAAEIFKLLKGEVPDLADNAAETYAKILTNIDDTNQVQRILNKTEFALSGGRDLTETKGLSLFESQKNPLDPLLSEARKYKSAEEFVNSMGVKEIPSKDSRLLYHVSENPNITELKPQTNGSRGVFVTPGEPSRSNGYVYAIDRTKLPEGALKQDPSQARDFYIDQPVPKEAVIPMGKIEQGRINRVSQLTDIWRRANNTKTINVPGIGEVPVIGTLDSAIGKITYDADVADDIIPAEIQEKADIDWDENYSQKVAQINDKLTTYQDELKVAQKKERAIIEEKIDTLTKESTKIENEFLAKWRGQPQTQIQARIDELDLEEYNLDMQEEYLLEHPINQLKKYESRSGEFKGELVEVKGVGKSKFAREGDQMADELGMTSEEARAKYVEIKTRKLQVKEAKRELKNERKALKEILKIAKSQKPPSQSVLSGTSPRLRGPLVESEVEARTLEEWAREKLEGSSLEGDLKSSSLDTIIQQAQIPVEKKVNILDYLRTPEKVLKKIGLEDEANYLREQYDKYLKELPQNIDKITEWSKQVPDESNVRIFDWLDGKAVDLRPEERKVGNEIKDWLAKWADRLELPEDNRITYYITHLFSDELIKKEFDQDLAKIIENKIAGEVYDPFLEKRLGAKGYKRDTWAALDAYVKRATRKVHMDPALERMKTRAPSLELSQWKYVKKYIDRVNMRPTDIDNLIDNGLKSVFGYRFGVRPLTSLTATLRRFTYRAMLGLNLGSSLRNISQGINTYAKLGEKYTVIGYAKLLSKEARDEIVREGVLGHGFVQDRIISATKKTLEKIDKGLYIFFETAEKINRGSAYLGAKAKALAEGKSEKEAIEYGKKIVRETQFTFGSIDTPVGMSSDIVKSLVQFQTYTTKQIEFLTEMAKNKEFLGLLRYAVAGLAFVYTIGQAFGMEKKELIPTYRLGVPPSMKFPWEVGRAIINAPDKYGRPRSMSDKARDILRTLTGLIPAGTQAKKTFEGIQAVQQGTATNAAGSRMFDVGGTPAKDTQAILFGKYASQEAKDYYNEDVSYAESQYQKLLKSPTAKEDFAKIIKNDPNLARSILKVKEKADLGITKEDEKILNMNNEPRAKFLYEKFNDLKTKEEKAALWEEYTKKKIITKDVAQKISELIKNPPKETSKVKSFINTILGIRTAEAAELQNTDVWIRDNRITHNDLYEAAAILFGEISDRNSEKQMLEARTILNTAFNRMDEYRKKGQEKTLTEVLQMDNQYQAYKGRLYEKFKKGGMDNPEELRRIESISNVIGEILEGTFQNNIGDYVFYKHLADGRIVASPGKLFK